MSTQANKFFSVEVFNALFKLASRPEYLMPASSASQLEIGAGLHEGHEDVFRDIVLFELGGVSEEKARRAFTLAAAKLI